jgi:hypothetical protein
LLAVVEYGQIQGVKSTADEESPKFLIEVQFLYSLPFLA